MTNELSRVVNVALVQEGRTVAYDNMNVIMIVTTDNSVLNTENRWIEVTPSEASGIFGAYSDVASWANIVGATKPNPTQVGGKLIVGYHRAIAEVVPERMSSIIGKQLDVPVFLSDIKKISNGGITVQVGSTATPVDGLDFSAVTSIDEVVAVLTEASESVSFRRDGERIIVQAKEDGEDLYFSDLVNTEPVAGLLGLTAGNGAENIPYRPQETLEPETRLEALNALSNEVQFKGVAFIDPILDAEILDLATWGSANQVLLYETFGDDRYTVVGDDNICWNVKMAGFVNFRMLWGKDRRYAAAYMARVHTVNFNGENTTLTMNLKELPIVPTKISDDLWSRLDRIGLDPYTTTKDTANVLCSSGNDFVDNEYNLYAFTNAVQTDVFNLLKSAHTKLAQIEPDGDLLVNQCEVTSRRFRRANFIGRGEWSNPNTMGDRDMFLRAIRNEGFYWQIGSFADQPQADRERRIAPLIQGAIKNAGAIHRADIIINFNK